ncbi:MAG: protein-disulfide reductase DsbD domain-containing protein [Pyrinomonadaceae bacterium]
MRRTLYTRRVTLLIVAAALLLVPASFNATPPPAAAPAVVPLQPNIAVNGFFSADKAQRGRMIQAAIVMDIPGGYHVNANKPLGKYAIATTVKIEAPGDIKASPVTYPRSNVRSFSFSKERLAVYEGRAVMRFNVTIPANFEPGVTELRARVRFQSCSNDACFPPVTRTVTMPIGIVGANEAVKRINGQIFGGGGGRRRR